MSGDSFFSRWSKRKHEAARGEVLPDSPPASQPPQSTNAAPAPAAPRALPAEPAPLPEVASLTPDSDFTPFMSAEVDAATRREALKALFSDPRFNVMDGLDVYIDDYSKPDPLPEGWLDKLEQVKRLGIFREEDRPEAQRVAENGPAAAQEAAKPEAIAEQAPGESAQPPIPLQKVRNPDPPEE